MRIGLFVEGTYPYSRGGVSEWVHELIASQPMNEFVLIHLSSKKQVNKPFKYPMHSNCIDVSEITLFDRPESDRNSTVLLPDDSFLPFFDPGFQFSKEKLLKLIHTLQEYKKQRGAVESIIRSSIGLDFILSEYDRLGSEIGWIDAFYQMRSALLPVLRILSQDWPRCDLYHSVSTGYAGLAATCASLIHGSPFILTEHGIYSFEREIELATVSWIPPDYEGDDLKDVTHNRMRAWWRGHYEALGKIAYQHSKRIYALTQMNQVMQIKRHADPKKIKIISNGVKSNFFDLGNKQIRSKTETRNLIFGFVGRVVSIKDVKTLIRSFALANESLKQKGILISLHCYGPTDEEPEYFNECVALVEELGVTEQIVWKGPFPAIEIYSKIDVLLLTSVSEGQPLSVLESMASGIPVIATRAGPCEEIVSNAGLICDIADIEALSHAMLLLAEDPELRLKLGERGFHKANQAFRSEAVWSQYLAEYQQALRLQETDQEMNQEHSWQE